MNIQTLLVRPTIAVAFLACGLLLAAPTAHAATTFTEQFSDAALDPALSTLVTNPTSSSFQIGAGMHFSGLVGNRSVGDNEGSSIVGMITNDSDYNTTDWVAEAVVYAPANNFQGNSGEMVFFGIGNPNGWQGDFFHSAISVRAHMGWDPNSWGWAYRYDVSAKSSGGTEFDGTLDTFKGNYMGGDNQELALRMTKTGDTLVYELDQNNDGSYEFSHTFDLTDAGFDWYDSSNSHIFLGMRRNILTEVDSFSVTNPVPEPSSFALAGLGMLGLAGWGLRRRARKGKPPRAQ